MGNTINRGRRNFIKSSAATAVGVTLGGGLFDRLIAGTADWTNGMQINPDIDNLRVVYARDPRMITIADTTPVATFLKQYCLTPATQLQNQVTYTDKALVQQYMDWMAYTLVAPKYPNATAKSAWAKIFRTSKPWASTRVAIKLNARILEFYPKLAIIDKVCRELIALGVQPANIVIYDMEPDDRPVKILNFMKSKVGTDLPSGIQISHGNDLLGGSTSTDVPGIGGNGCTADIAQGKIDILINIARNQEHSPEWGQATICMKNHFGTFDPIHTDQTVLVNMHKANAIIGGTPPRQQLCIVDSLVGSGQTISASLTPPDQRLNMLVMGTCGPIVDYQVIDKIRRTMPGANPDMDRVNDFAVMLGYTTSDPKWVQALQPPSTGVSEAQRFHGGSLITLRAAGASRPSFVNLELPATGEVVQVRILTMAGRFVRNFNIVPGSQTTVTWDGRSENGVRLPAGTYAVHVHCGGRQAGGAISLS